MREVMTRMATDSAHERWWQIGEVVFGIPFLVAIGLQLTVPLSLPRGILMAVFKLGGVALVVVGVALVVLARREFARRGQPTDPGRPTRTIVTAGVFSVSRNPMYLGAVCFLAGIALTFNLPWVLVLLILAVLACHSVLIVPEERYLADEFGDEYRAYVDSVPRWIGRSRPTR